MQTEIEILQHQVAVLQAQLAKQAELIRIARDSMGVDWNTGDWVINDRGADALCDLAGMVG